MGDEFLDGGLVHAARGELGTDGFRILSKGKGLGLRKVVRHEDGVVIGRGTNVLGDIVLGLAGGQEIARDEFGSLVDQLVEGVLSVGSGFSPNNRSGLAVNLFSVLGDVLSVGFHVTLLEVGRESVHVLVVRQNGTGFAVVKVVVPDSEHTKCEGNVLLWWAVHEVVVHGVGTGVHLHPVVETDRQSDRGSDGTPQGVSSTDPVPESKHVVGIDSEFRNTGAIRREGRKVLGNRGFVAVEGLQDKGLGASGVGHGFLRGKCLRGNQKESGFRIDTL
mmetsp:Transcript_16392/g.37595  ORF Transcript_16392/g.37595 Transcript_16392/m.37595 type:complete len:276 (+) Transcript_16392:412-1239(+)